MKKDDADLIDIRSWSAEWAPHMHSVAVSRLLIKGCHSFERQTPPCLPCEAAAPLVSMQRGNQLKLTLTDDQLWFGLILTAAGAGAEDGLTLLLLTNQPARFMHRPDRRFPAGCVLNAGLTTWRWVDFFIFFVKWPVEVLQEKNDDAQEAILDPMIQRERTKTSGRLRPETRFLTNLPMQIILFIHCFLNLPNYI